MGDFLNLFDAYVKAGSLLAYAAAFAGGALISFTPCVYPLLPVTVGYVGGMSRGSRARGFLLSLSYALGMAAVYAAFGAAAALSGRVFGAAAASPVANIAVGAICVLMGLSLFDLFQIPVRSLSTGAGGGRGGAAGAFAFGAVSGLVVGPCTAPVMGSLLVYVGSRQNVLFGTSLLFTFALGMGLLPVLGGTFAGFLAALPRSGPWLPRVKKGFGAVLIAAGLAFLLTAAAPKAGSERRAAAPEVTPAASPAPAPAAGSGAGEMTDFTLPDTAGRPVTLSRVAEKAPVLLVFWATWCPYCNAAVPEINALLPGRAGSDLRILALDYKESREVVNAFIRAKGVKYPVLLDADGAVARTYGVVGIPTYVVVGREGKIAYRGNVLPEKIRQYLD